LPSMDKALKADLTKIVVEKLLIGAVILCLGMFTANRIEHFKSSQSFISEFNKLRVQKIGEVWEQVYVWEAVVEQNSARAWNILGKGGPTLEDIRQTATELAGVADENIRKKNELLAAANKNRFWIGEEQYEAITDYVAVTERYQSELERATHPMQRDAAVSKDAALKLDAERKKKRATFLAIRAQMLRE
jgi:hypothetical protein